MKRILISTSKVKALSCAREGEPNFENQIKDLIGNLDSKKVIKYYDTELYFLIDTYNGNDKIDFQFDFENDILLYHNISIDSSKDFIEKFTYKKDAIHNENSLYRKVYEVFINNGPDKYSSIFALLKTEIEKLNTSAATSFLKDIGNKNITLSQLTEKHPDFTQSKAFKAIYNTFYDNDSNVFNCNNSDHLSAFQQLREKLNNPN